MHKKKLRVNLKVTEYKRTGFYEEWTKSYYEETWHNIHDYSDDDIDEEDLRDILLDIEHPKKKSDDCSMIYCISDSLPVSTLLNIPEFDDDEELTIVDVSLPELKLDSPDSPNATENFKSYFFRSLSIVNSIFNIVFAVMMYSFMTLVYVTFTVLIILIYTPYMLSKYLINDFWFYMWIFKRYLRHPVAFVINYFKGVYRRKINLCKRTYIQMYNLFHPNDPKVYQNGLEVEFIYKPLIKTSTRTLLNRVEMQETPYDTSPFD